MFGRRKEYYQTDIKLIVGLGNFGMDYANTRHNIGFQVIKLVLKKLGIPESALMSKFSSQFWKGKLNGEYNIIIARPSTYINSTWQFLKDIMSYYEIKPENVLLIYDEKNIEIGNIRLRNSIPSTSHNGIKEIVNNCKFPVYNRISIGIGSELLSKVKLERFVLGKITPHESHILNPVLKIACEAALDFITVNSFDLLIQKYNDPKILKNNNFKSNY